MKGLHSLLRTTRDVLALGVPGPRILPVINRAPKGPRARAELTATFGALLGPLADQEGVPSPVHVPERRRLDDVQRDGARLPDAWVMPLATTVQALLDRAGVDDGLSDASDAVGELLQVRPGELGRWTEDDAVG
jgi:hypothetical protein